MLQINQLNPIGLIQSLTQILSFLTVCEKKQSHLI
jgi:hypothetical protein